MSSIKWIRRTISVLILGTVVLILSTVIVANGASSVIRPQNRITEPDRVEQHLRVQDEIYKNLSRLLVYQDSNYTQYGYDSAEVDGSVTISLGTKYLTANDYASMLTVMVPCDSVLWTSTFTDSSFVVNNPNASKVYFDWFTVGVKK